MKDKVTIIFGDSIAYGLYDKENFGWVNRMHLKEDYAYYFNLSIPGQSSSDILKRFENEFLARYNKEDEFKIIFAFGIKDALILNKDENHLNIFKENVMSLIKIALNYTDKINFIGLGHVDLGIRDEYNNDNILAIDNLLKEICLYYKLNYIKTNDILTDLELTDGLHPSLEGHKKLAEYIFSKLN